MPAVSNANQTSLRTDSRSASLGLDTQLLQLVQLLNRRVDLNVKGSLRHRHAIRQARARSRSHRTRSGRRRLRFRNAPGSRDLARTTGALTDALLIWDARTGPAQRTPLIGCATAHEAREREMLAMIIKDT